MTDEKPDFVRGKDGFLRRNPKISMFDRRSYKAPSEALVSTYAGAERFCCVERVFSDYSSGPCSHKAKYDPDQNGNPTKCGHHSEAAKKRKADKEAARTAAFLSKMDHADRMRKIDARKEDIIRLIANGHNDPRSLCQEWLEEKEKATIEGLRGQS